MFCDVLSSSTSSASSTLDWDTEIHSSIFSSASSSSSSSSSSSYISSSSYSSSASSWTIVCTTPWMRECAISPDGAGNRLIESLSLNAVLCKVVFAMVWMWMGEECTARRDQIFERGRRENMLGGGVDFCSKLS